MSTKNVVEMGMTRQALGTQPRYKTHVTWSKTEFKKTQ